MGQSADRLKHSAWLDWVRGTAALVVFAAHLRTFSFVVYGSLPAEDQTLLNAVWFAVTRFGHDAVVIFFVLSGFLVGGSALDLARSGRFDVSRYATARIARIGIVCVPAVMLGWAVFTYSGETLPLATVLGNMVGLQTVAVPVIEVNGPLWSLSYEIWFYVLCGAALSVTSRSLPYVAIPVALVSLYVLTYVLNATYLIYWLAGAAAFLWRPRRFQAYFLLVATFLMTAGLGLHHVARSTYTTAMHTALASQVAPVSTIDAVSQWMFVGGAALLMPFLRNLGMPRGLAHVGYGLAAFSYSLYLSHYPVLWFMGTFLPQASDVSWRSMAEMAFRGAVCLSVALLFYWLFERRTSQLREVLSRVSWIWTQERIAPFVFARGRNAGFPSGDPSLSAYSVETKDGTRAQPPHF